MMIPGRHTTWSALVAALMTLAIVQPARAQDGGDVVEACYESAGEVADGKACRNVQQLVYGTGRACRHAAPREACAPVDGRMVSEELVAGFERSWVPRALGLQRGLDDDLPLTGELWVHTHNSFNTEAYTPTFSGLDPNQVYSLTDQLRMGVRAIEIDVHWAPSLEGRPEDGGNAPVVCHGEPIGLGPLVLHFGCTTEIHLRTRLAEVRDWLMRPENAAEVLIVYLENNLDGDPVAHRRASEAIEETLGGLVHRPAPAGTSCAPMPFDLSRGAIRAAGKRVLLTGNCGAGAWQTWVFERGPRWLEDKSEPGPDYPDYPECVADERVPRGYGTNWIRFYEDSTWLSAMVAGTGLGGPGEITAAEAGRMVRCGVNMPGFDQLRPFDGRLEAAVWSWAPDEPSTSTCAYAGGDGRFRSDDCGEPRQFACFDAAAGWTVTTSRGPWDEGAAACSETSRAFAVPKGGFENELLKVARGPAEVWLDYRYVPEAGRWPPKVAQRVRAVPRDDYPDDVATQRPALPPETRIGHVHLKVADLDRALDFYCDILGFELTTRLGEGAAFISAGGYHHHIGLNTWESKGAAPAPPGYTGLYHHAILFPDRTSLAQAVRRVIERGWPITGASDHGVSEAVYLDDPDGNGVELYRDRPPEEWPRAQDGRIEMYTRRLDMEALLAEAKE